MFWGFTLQWRDAVLFRRKLSVYQTMWRLIPSSQNFASSLNTQICICEYIYDLETWFYFPNHSGAVHWCEVDILITSYLALTSCSRVSLCNVTCRPISRQLPQYTRGQQYRSNVLCGSLTDAIHILAYAVTSRKNREAVFTVVVRVERS
jgi:hypothetical protein